MRARSRFRHGTAAGRGDQDDGECVAQGAEDP
jgi:hypothetical protein